MNKKFLILIFSLLIVSCGKKDGPDQTYIANDEKSSTTSTSTDKSLDQNSKTLALENVSFSEDTCDSNNLQRDVMIFSEKIEALGGSVLSVSNYDQNLQGFQQFLNESGVTSLNAADLSMAGTKSKMKTCDLKDLTPPKSCWYRSLTLALLSEKIEIDTGVSLEVTSHYRNSCYNQTVKGSKRSDHLAAKAIDISLGSQENRHKVEEYICEQMWKDNFFPSEKESTLNNISIGIGETFLHLGIDSVHGRRHWVYDKYIENNSMPSTCWKVKS